VCARFGPGEGAPPARAPGLGLAIARAIARAHGGEVRVADGRPGHCSLEVQLPLAGAASTG